MISKELFCVYKMKGQNLSFSDELPEGLQYKFWQPSIFSIKPPDLSLKFFIWTLFSWFRIFKNSEYSILYIIKGGSIVHRSCVIPAYFRWPFMENNDLQISSTFTAPDSRGNGLAKIALAHIMKTFDMKKRTFWYVSRQKNQGSIKVCQKVGFKLAGYAKKLSPGFFGTWGYLALKPVNSKNKNWRKG